MNEVSIRYDPFLPETRIEVNGRRLSEYSPLNEYRHTALTEWVDAFFREIRYETNGSYRVFLTAPLSESVIFEAMAGEDSFCEGVKTHPLPEGRDAVSRLADLQMLGDTDLPTEVRVGIWSPDASLPDGFFELLGEEGIYSEEEDGVFVNEDVPLTVVRIVRAEETYTLSHCDLRIALTQGVSDWDITELGRMDKEVFLYDLGEGDRFLRKEGKVLIFSTGGESITKQVIDLIVSRLLPEVLSNRAYEMTKKVQAGAIRLLPDERERLDSLCLTDRSIKLVLPAETYAGRMLHAQVRVVPEGSVSFTLKSRYGLFSIEGDRLTAAGPGVDEIELYADGEATPSDRVRITVRSGVRIGRVSVDAKYRILPAGGTTKVDLTYSPEDAVNADEITWRSDDESVAAVSDGLIAGRGEGRCRVTVGTPDAEAEFQVEVMPHLQKVVLSERILTLSAGERRNWQYTLVPENCYERDLIRVRSSNEQVASWSGGYLIAIRPGDCTIYVTGPDGETAGSCQVHVTGKR